MTAAIVTKRLRLVPFAGDDAHVRKHVEWLNDPEIVKFSEQRHRKHTVEFQKMYISMMEQHFYREIMVGEKLIGTVAASIDSNNQIADLGILIGDREEWGKGYGTEAWRGAVDHLFCTVRKVEAGCMAVNHGMRKICMNTGMKMEGIRDAHFILNGGFTPMIYFGKFR